MSEAQAAADQGAQSRALWLSTLAFTVCFAAWTIFSILGVQIKRDLGLTEFEFGLLVGTPILTGSLSRLALGVWTDQYGGRVMFTIVMVTAAVATALLALAYDYTTFLLAALGIGIEGGSFAVGVAYVSKWYPKGKQGTALGIFGAGNVGAAVTKFLAPIVLVAMGWKAVALIWAAALLVMAVAFFLFTKDDPDLAARKATGAKPEFFAAMMEPLKNVQVWRFSLYYFFVFGGFVALALWLPRYIIDAYGFDIKTASMIGAAYSVPASIFRAYGGLLSDKHGARRVMYRKQLDIFCDPHDPQVIEQARRDGVPEAWLDAARSSPTYKMCIDWQIAFPLHPEYRTLPMVWYVPPLSPVQSAIEAGHVGWKDGLPDIASLRIPVKYLANLLTAGAETPVILALQRMLAMRMHMRARTVENREDLEILEKVGLTKAQVDDMYNTLAIANYEDRYVIPTTHREYAENAFDLKSSCGFSFGQGCYDGRTVGNLFSASGPSAGRMAPTRIREAAEAQKESQS